MLTISKFSIVRNCENFALTCIRTKQVINVKIFFHNIVFSSTFSKLIYSKNKIRYFFHRPANIMHFRDIGGKQNQKFFLQT